jgi:RHS repeat-associated protein
MTGISRYASLDTSAPVASSTHTYDLASRLTGISHQQGANVISNQTWVYDMVSRITQFASPDGTSAYSYDNTDQLTAADHSYQTDEAYTYDANGNRRNTGYSTTTYNRLSRAGVYTYTYDNEGNRLKRTRSSPSETVDYTWDHRNRLTKVEVKSGTTVVKSATYTYDVFDRRIGISLYPDGSPTIPPTAERRFVYDRDHILLSFDSASNLTHRYMHGAMLDQILADDSNGNIRWALTDNLGTVRDVVNSSGVVVNHNKYDSFGNITNQTSPGNNIRFAFTGREWDALIGLYFYRGRYYDPVVGRFISEDPISFAGGDVNLYRYVENSPVNFTDPFGYFTGSFPAKAPPKIPLKIRILPGILSPLIDLLFPEPLDDPEWSDPKPAPKRRKCPPVNKKDKWECKASCNVQQVDRKVACPERSTGSGSGSNENEACAAAKRSATQATPRGCYPRHCQCNCRKN